MGIGVMRIVQHPVGQARLHDAPALHHDHALRQEARDGEVVGDENDGQAEIGDEGAQEIEHARLDGDIETAGRLVHEDQPRPGDEVARDLQALAHAAREGDRLIVDPLGGDLHRPSQSIAVWRRAP